MSSTTIYICLKLGKMLTVHYILKINDKFIWNDLKVRETYLRVRQKTNTSFWRRRQHSYGGKLRAPATGNARANILNFRSPSSLKSLIADQFTSIGRTLHLLGFSANSEAFIHYFAIIDE